MKILFILTKLLSLTELITYNRSVILNKLDTHYKKYTKYLFYTMGKSISVLTPNIKQ